MVGTVLQRIVELLRVHGRTLAPVALAVGLLDTLVGVLLGAIVMTIPANPDPATTDVGAILGGVLFGTVLSFVVTLVISAVMFNMVAQVATTGSADVNEALAVTFRRFGSLVGLVLLTALAVFLGFLLLVVPGIYVAVALVPSMALLFVEDRRALDAFTASFSLVRGSWWQVFLALVVVAIFGAVLGAVGQAPGIAGFLLSVLASALLSIVQPALVYFVYRELRARRGAAPEGPPAR